TTTLTITVGASDLRATTDAALVNEAGLAVIGSHAGDGSNVFSGTVADNVSGGAGTDTFALVGSGTTANGTIVLTTDGTSTYTLQHPVTEATANNGTDTVPNVDTFTYQV